MPPIVAPQYAHMRSASEWMKPLPRPERPTGSTLVEIPANWYAEDMTPMQFWPHTPNSQGYVDARVMERMWMDRFEWLMRERDELVEEGDGEKEMVVFSLVMHPDTSGMAHVIGMIERFLGWLRAKGEEVEWLTCGEVAERWKGMQER
jgi:hypothetical protein